LVAAIVLFVTGAAGFGGFIAMKVGVAPTLACVGGYAANRQMAKKEEKPPDVIAFQSGGTTMALPEDGLLEFGYYVGQREKPEYVPKLVTDERFGQLVVEGKMLGQAFIQAGHLAHKPAG
tara:strand:+ start:165 stop:524 length:360 start_codon:yes stop_codon:yes gene_type:complete